MWLLNAYHQSFRKMPSTVYLNKIPDDTVFDFVSKLSEDVPFYYTGRVYTPQDLREIFAFVREEHYELFKDFYECTANKLGGKL